MSSGSGCTAHAYNTDGPAHAGPYTVTLEVIDAKKATRMTVKDNCWRAKDSCATTDFLAIWNASFDPDLKADAGWTPVLYGSGRGPETAEAAYPRVLDEAGPARATR